jgi:hypothetical protein
LADQSGTVFIGYTLDPSISAAIVNTANSLGEQLSASELNGYSEMGDLSSDGITLSVCYS